jgi:hypothetical protein
MKAAGRIAAAAVAAALASQLAACGDFGVDKGAVAIQAQADLEARAAFDDLRAGNYPALEARIVPEMRTAETHTALLDLHGRLPQGTPAPGQEVGSQGSREFVGDKGRYILVLRHDYAYPGGAVAHVETTLSRPIKDTVGDTPFLLAFIRGIRTEPVPGTKVALESMDVGVTRAPDR